MHSLFRMVRMILNKQLSYPWFLTTFDPREKNFSKISIEIGLTFSFKKMRLKLSSAKWWPFCLGLNVLNWFKMSTSETFKSCEVLPSLSLSFSWLRLQECRQSSRHVPDNPSAAASALIHITSLTQFVWLVTWYMFGHNYVVSIIPADGLLAHRAWQYPDNKGPGINVD